MRIVEPRLSNLVGISPLKRYLLKTRSELSDFSGIDVSTVYFP